MYLHKLAINERINNYRFLILSWYHSLGFNDQDRLFLISNMDPYLWDSSLLLFFYLVISCSVFHFCCSAQHLSFPATAPMFLGLSIHPVQTQPPIQPNPSEFPCPSTLTNPAYGRSQPSCVIVSVVLSRSSL